MYIVGINRKTVKFAKKFRKLTRNQEPKFAEIWTGWLFKFFPGNKIIYRQNIKHILMKYTVINCRYAIKVINNYKRPADWRSSTISWSFDSIKSITSDVLSRITSRGLLCSDENSPIAGNSSSVTSSILSSKPSILLE